MTSELTPEQQKDHLKQESAFAQMGQQVLNNAAYKRALFLRKAQLFEDFSNTKQDQSDVREEAWRTMQNIKALEKFFEETLTTGKMADTSLESLKDPNESNKQD